MGVEFDPHAAEGYDDQSMIMHVQQFLDEWQFRMFHSNLAFTMDRLSCMVKALDLLVACGIDIADEEKPQLAALDESELVETLVKRMSMTTRKSFEHFALQLQLVISTATRVRHSLENLVECTEEGGDVEAAKQELAHIMGDGEAGVLQQILKQTIVQAGEQVHELDIIQGSWLKNTEERLKRLNRGAEECEHYNQQLFAIESQLSAFAGEQNAKSKKVLMSLCAGQGKALVHSVFSSWEGYCIKVKSEFAIHQKFRDQIARAQAKLVEMQKNSFNNIRSAMMRDGAEGNETLKSIVLGAWQKAIRGDKDDAESLAKLKIAQDKLSHYRQEAQDNTRKVMMRMSAGNDNMLLELVVQSWFKCLEALRADRLYEDQVKAQEVALAEHMVRKKDEAKNVMNRMMAGSDTGLMFEYFKEWNDVLKEEKKHQEMDRHINGADSRFKSLAQRQRTTANGVAMRTNRIDENNFIFRFFQEWLTEAKCSRIIGHYSNKLHGKKGQLDAVQSLFKSFASQLEQGIGNTPRSQRKSNRRPEGSERGPSAAPPLPPAAPQRAT